MDSEDDVGEKLVFVLSELRRKLCLGGRSSNMERVRRYKMLRVILLKRKSMFYEFYISRNKGFFIAGVYEFVLIYIRRIIQKDIGDFFRLKFIYITVRIEGDSKVIKGF